MSCKNDLIYLDNAATSYPKPREVLNKMEKKYSSIGVSPGRGSYDLSVEAENSVNEARKHICKFFGGDDPSRVIFAYNATDALNTMILGLAEAGSHVVSSQLEHNSVLRPLYYLKEKGIIDLELVPFNSDGFIDPAIIAASINQKTKFVILTHGSNVLGTIQPIKEIGVHCRKMGVPLLLDVTQTAGIIPIDMEELGVSGLAFTGHKSLLAPTGIGGLVLSRSLDVQTTRFGGTGSDSINLVHPKEYPQKLEAGTINVMGVFGLKAGLEYIEKQDIENIYAHEMALTRWLVNELSSMSKVKLYCTGNLKHHLPLFICNIEGMTSEQVSAVLDGDYGIATRAGLHCSPLTHVKLGTDLGGAVRFSVGFFNTITEIATVKEAVREISENRRSQ
jgi:cysteine desulfurase / selenocysteine lyase